MKGMRTIFLSSTARDLCQYRDRAYAVIESLTGYHCVRMEDFTSQPRDPLSCLDEIIASCDLFVALVGLCYGSCPQSFDTSFTEHEYDRAKEKGIPRLVFMLPESFAMPANLLIADGRWDKQMRFRHKVNDDLVRAEFSNPDQLAAQIAAAIRNWEHGSKQGVATGHPETIDCIILCGGYARRLWPLTVDISKVTLPVANKPVLAHVLDFVTKSRFVRNVVLSVNAKYAQQMAAFTGISHAAGRTIEVIAEPESGPEGKLGPIGAIDYVVARTEPRDLLVVGGDNLFGFDLEDLQRFAAERDRSVNALFRFPSLEDVSEYGVASLSPQGDFVDFQEKSARPSFRDVSTACYLLRRPDINALRKYLSDGHDPDSLGNFIRWLVTQGRPPVGFQFSSFWFDIGTREKLLAANRHFILDHRRGNSVNSSFKAPVLIHETATVENSFVGPDVSLGPTVRVSGSQVSNSIVLEGAVVRNSRLSDSIVGPGSVVQGHVVDLVCGPRSKIYHDAHEA